MEQVTGWLHNITNIEQDILSKIIISILILIVLKIIHLVVLKIMWKNIEEPRKRYRWKKTVTYIFVFIGFLILGRVWLKAFQSLATFLGLLSAGLAIALKDIITDIAGWIFIIWRKPFEVGDRIEVGKHAGDVIDIRLFQFSLLEIRNWVDADQSTGRIINIPNSRALNDVVANFSKGFQYIWNEIPVLITFESNWRKAKTILQQIGNKHAEHLTPHAQRRLKEASRKFMIFYKNLTPTVYTSVKDSGVMLTVRYLCEPRRRRATEQAIWEDILVVFNSTPGIEFAYPTQRFYYDKARDFSMESPEKMVDENDQSEGDDKNGI
ncbi:MAG TPA: mechanosensitive ion channel [Candidatus Cloacimonetes bacterium]|nr:mechanosensitive ion channel [Candidatus Cloacimonadota bacterium]HEX37358.1 mechanosensitive ion channel [Candidatus Cloacimonadota bacterium]